MDIKDSYLHGTVGVVKSIDINADKLIYKLADVASTTITITLPLATTIANGLMSKEDKIAINSLVNYVTLDTTLIISGVKTFSSLVEFTSEDGIAPFIVTSNTVVTNLNADRLDGLHSFDFIKYDHHIDSSTTTMSTRHIGYGYAEYGFICSGPAISIGSGDGYIMQILQEINSSNTYIRYGNPDGFGAWKQLAFVGEATVSNADTVDGLHASDFVIQRGHVPTSMANVLGYGYEDEGWKRTGPIISFGDPSYYAQIQTSYNDVDTVMRINNNGVFSDWKAIAFTDGIIEFAKKFVPRYITNLNTDGINEFFSSCFQADNRPTTRNYATGFTVYNDELAFTYQFAFDTYGDVHTRYKTSTEWQPWRRLAFTTDTVEVANKLSTTRYLWGQPFDGSGDVYGDLKSINGYNFVSTTSNHVLFGYGYAQNNKTVYLDGSPIYFRYGTNHNVGMILNSNGRVGIGTSTPSSELHVVGRPIFNHNGQHGDAGLIVIQNNASITGWDRAIFAHYPNLEAGAHANFHIGKANSAKNGGYISYYHAGDSSGNNCMTIGLYATDDILNVTANRCVGINTTTPRGTLDVNGSSVIDGFVYLKGNNRRIYFYNSEYEGLFIDNNGINWHDATDSFAFNIMTFSSNKRVGINTTTPEHTLDVNGSSIFRNHIYVKKYHHIFMNTGEEGVYYTDDGLYWHNANNEYVRSLIKVNNSGYVGIGITTPEYKLDVNGSAIIRDSLHTLGYILLDGTDQINGTNSGIALNYNCGKIVNTSIFNGAGSNIAKFYGDSKQTQLFGNLLIGSDTNRNYIAFHGTTGDIDGFNNTYIGENLWGTPESSELVLFKGNDFGSSATTATDPGPDRIRHIAAGHLFQIYKSALSGTFDTVCKSIVPVNMLAIHLNSIQTYAPLVIVGEQNDGNYGINMQNSDIVGINALYTSDNAEGGDEGLQFSRGNGYYDSVWASGGVLYFSPNGNLNRAGSYSNNYTVLHSNNAKESVGEFGYVMRNYIIDASALDENTWYPVTIPCTGRHTIRIECIIHLDSGTKPSWSTHSSGFSVRKIWEVNGCGWGTAPINRLVYVSDYSFANTDPVRGIGQLGNGSIEYVYVRGGGKYFFFTSHNKVPTLRTSTYTANDLSVSPTTTTPATIRTIVDVYQLGYYTSSTISNLPVYKQSVICTISASGTLGFADAIPEGRELHVIIKNTSSSAITITIPSTMINVMGENLKIDGNSYGELNILSCGSYYVRGVS